MKISRRALQTVLLLVALDLFLGSGGLLELAARFAFGWIYSFARFSQRFEFTWAHAWWITGLVAFVLLLTWFFAGSGTARGRCRIVSVFTGICFCALLAGMSLAGSVHQLAWLATSESGPSGDLNHRRAALFEAASIADALMQTQPGRDEWENAWRGAIENGVPDRPEPHFHAHFATHLRVAQNGTVQEVVLWPRNGDDFRKIGGMIVRGRTTHEAVSRERLLTYLHSQRELENER